MVSTIEMLPDEILLDICRYLHSGDVLYAFFNINSRLNRTILWYCQHVSFHQAFYLQCQHLCERILPEMDFLIRSLVICELESPLFERTFQTSRSYPNLEKIIFVNWTDQKFLRFIAFLNQFEQLTKFVIKSFNVTGKIPHRSILEDIFRANQNRLTSICFNSECDWLDLSETSPSTPSTTNFSNILELEIELENINDFCELTSMIPNVEYIHVSFKEPLIDPERFLRPFLQLKRFSVYSMSHFMRSENFLYLMKMIPVVENLLLIIITRDSKIINREDLIQSIPSTVKNLNLSICYQAESKEIDSRAKKTLQSWSSTPISLISNEKHRRNFFYTLPYPYHRLALRSSYHQSMINASLHWSLTKIQHLHIYDTVAIAEALPIIQHCRNVVDLYISISKRSSDEDLSKMSIVLPRLKYLKFLCIDGTPVDLDQFEKLLAATPSLSTLSVRFDCLMKLLEDENQSLRTFYLLNRLVDVLCIRFEETIYQNLTENQIHSIARIFYGVHRLAIDLTDSRIIIDLPLLSLLLTNFPRLTVLSIYGTPADSYSDLSLREYLIETKQIEHFQIDCGHQRIKIWL